MENPGQLLLYGGIFLMAASAAASIAAICINRVKSARLRARLEAEYGPMEKNAR